MNGIEKHNIKNQNIFINRPLFQALPSKIQPDEYDKTVGLTSSPIIIRFVASMRLS